MSELNRQPWPEVDPPAGWKKNPHAGKRLNLILILTVIVAGGVTALSAGRSEVLPVVCFLALVALPILGPVISRIGFGVNDKKGRQVHPVTADELKVEGGCMMRLRAPYQKLHLPDEMDGEPIVSAAAGLLSGNRALAYIHLPQSLEALPERMFMGCDNLPALVVPPAVRAIGSRAFKGCAELKDVYLPASVEEIAPDAFEGCGQVILHVRAGSAAEAFAKTMDLLFSVK